MLRKFTLLFFLTSLLSCQDTDRKEQEGGLSYQELPKSYTLTEPKRITIPEHPGAYNASLFRHQSRNLLAYRWDKNANVRHLGIAELDEQMDLTGPGQILEEEDLLKKLRLPEDPRLFTFKGQLYIMFNDVTEAFRQIFIAKVNRNADGNYYLSGTVRLRYDAGMTQKNWIPFEAEGELKVVYYMDPLTVLNCIPESGECVHAERTAHKMYPWNQYPWVAKGQLRGGSAAFYDEDFDAYLTFFHSSRKSGGVNHYYMGAATFKKESPWNFTRMTPYHLEYPGLYDDENNPRKIVFPCGYIKSGDHYFVSYGVSDSQTEIAKISRSDLKKIMVGL